MKKSFFCGFLVIVAFVGFALELSRAEIDYCKQNRSQLVGVSWGYLQGVYQNNDEAGIKTALAACGASYMSTDAQGSPEKQLNDINTLIARGAKALIVLAQDKDAIGPAILNAKAAKIPVIAYDSLIEDPDVYYLAFDKVPEILAKAQEALRLKDIAAGQDPDKAALNRIARGTQTEWVWKNYRALGKAAGGIAVALANGSALSAIEGTKIFKDGPKKVAMNTTLLTPIIITRFNLNLVLEAGEIKKDELCRGGDTSRIAICK